MCTPLHLGVFYISLRTSECEVPDRTFALDCLAWIVANPLAAIVWSLEYVCWYNAKSDNVFEIVLLIPALFSNECYKTHFNVHGENGVKCTDSHF